MTELTRKEIEEIMRKHIGNYETADSYEQSVKEATAAILRLLEQREREARIEVLNGLLEFRTNDFKPLIEGRLNQELKGESDETPSEKS